MLEELADVAFRAGWLRRTGMLTIRSRGGGALKARVKPAEALRFIDSLESAEYQRSAAARPR